MKYFLDTEFLEGTQRTVFLKKTKPTIDLISIGLVDEKSREFYAISKEFNIKEAWNRYQLEPNKQYPTGPEHNKVYWIRENVLRPIFVELKKRYFEELNAWDNDDPLMKAKDIWSFTLKNITWLIHRYGYRNIEIANMICHFIYRHKADGSGKGPLELAMGYNEAKPQEDPEFYAYYADYDWVAFCWLFGKMNDLPPFFPKYCRDLKQMLDEKFSFSTSQVESEYTSLENKLSYVKQRADYPKATDEHNALADARWNKKLYEFLLSQ